MDHLTFIKLGGSIITRKDEPETPDFLAMHRLAHDLAGARAARPELRMLIGHGSGSFGHHYAAKYGVHRGLATGADWLGFALTARAARRLNHIMIDKLMQAGVPALALQPSASLQSAGGVPLAWHTAPIMQALQHGLVPVVHGDVAFDNAQGSAIISTEALFAHLALQTSLRPVRIILVGETAVYTADPAIDRFARLIPLITSANIDKVLDQAGGSRSVDVTGGMRSKIEAMWRLVQAVPGLEIHLLGPQPGLLVWTLLGETTDLGTCLRMRP